jgi:hypothetical protein
MNAAVDSGTIFILGQIVGAAGVTVGFFAHQYHAGNPPITVDFISRRDTETLRKSGALQASQLYGACSQAVAQWLETGGSVTVDIPPPLSIPSAPKTLGAAPRPKL